MGRSPTLLRITPTPCRQKSAGKPTSNPQAHRTLIIRKLKGLESLIDVYHVHPIAGPDGWYFSGQGDSPSEDPLHPGFTTLKQLYLKADPTYTGRYTVPVLWDRKQDVMVNNESSEILRMLASEFDHLLPETQREANKPGGGLYPEHLRAEIDALNDQIYHTLNNGVYKVGFAKSQEAYDANIGPLFSTLDELEARLEDKPYLHGESLTESDIRLYTTLARFDAAYNPVMMSTRKTIRHDYPRLHNWLRRLYWDVDGIFNNAFRGTTAPFSLYTQCYANGRQKIVFGPDAPLIVPDLPGEEVLVPRLIA